MEWTEEEATPSTGKERCFHVEVTTRSTRYGMDCNGRTAERCEGGWRELLPFWKSGGCALESAIFSRDRRRSSARMRPAFRRPAACTEACLICDLMRRHGGSQVARAKKHMHITCRPNRAGLALVQRGPTLCAGPGCVWVRRKPSRTARGQHVHDRPLFAWPTISPLSRTPLHSVIFYSCSLRSHSLLCFSPRCYCCCVVTPSHLYQRIRAFPARVAS
jgi:hypothetical protein